MPALRRDAPALAVVALAAAVLATVVTPAGAAPVPGAPGTYFDPLPGIAVPPGGLHSVCDPEPEPEPSRPDDGGESYSDVDCGDAEPAGPGDIAAMAASLEAGVAACAAQSAAWRASCLGDELERMARRLPAGSSESAAREAILDAAARLRAIAAANADPGQPPVRRAVEIDGRRRVSTRPLIAVAPDRVAAAHAAAAAVLDELGTTLLRSPGNDPATRAEFARVAGAVASAKVLLRST